MYISVFDIIKIGIGPSSSHTMGPWNACRLFLNSLKEKNILSETKEVEVILYGSLAKTGKGHGTDVAIMLALSGFDFKTIDPDNILDYIEEIKKNNNIALDNKYNISFVYDKHLIFNYNEILPKHPNGMSISAYNENRKSLFTSNYYSVGGGFVEKDDEDKSDTIFNEKYIIETAEDVAQHCKNLKIDIPELVLRNELEHLSTEIIDKNIESIWNEIKECIYRGVNKEGILPGGLNVRRRANGLHLGMLSNAMYSNSDEWIQCIQKSNHSFTSINKWISCFALAVNEENASFGRIVTAPTNGAAGVIPAVIMYAYCFTPNFNTDKRKRFILTAGLIGTLFKKKATISAAMGGCQAEIGVSSAMAAAALTETMGGSVGQCLMAAEIAMEHHLGMTCDPIGGLVQIPCIERNSMGAIKAITASNIALESDPDNARVSLDSCIKTMWQTALDMNVKYKETSEGGLAINIPVSVAEC